MDYYGNNDFRDYRNGSYLAHYGRKGMKKGKHLPGTTWWRDLTEWAGNTQKNPIRNAMVTMNSTNQMKEAMRTFRNVNGAGATRTGDYRQGTFKRTDNSERERTLRAAESQYRSGAETLRYAQTKYDKEGNALPTKEDKKRAKKNRKGIFGWFKKKPAKVTGRAIRDRVISNRETKGLAARSSESFTRASSGKKAATKKKYEYTARRAETNAKKNAAQAPYRARRNNERRYRAREAYARGLGGVLSSSKRYSN